MIICSEIHRQGKQFYHHPHGFFRFWPVFTAGESVRGDVVDAGSVGAVPFANDRRFVVLLVFGVAGAAAAILPLSLTAWACPLMTGRGGIGVDVAAKQKYVRMLCTVVIGESYIHGTAWA